METLVLFLTIIAYVGFAISVFMIWMHIYNDYQLNHTASGKLRQTLAAVEGKQLVVRPVRKYVVMLVISGAWLITTYMS